MEVFLARIEEVVESELRSDPDAVSAGRHTWLPIFSRLHHEDLFLASACARGDRIAWEYFADDYLPLVQRFAAHACKNLEEAQDLSQELVTSLLGSSETGRQTRLAGYNGRGSLAGWLRVAVAHAAIDRFRRSRKQVSLDEMEEQGREHPALSDAAVPVSIEDGLDSRWGPVLSRLLAQELQRLQTRDRLLLCLYYLHGVPLKDIGRQFSVHEATASRWLENLRKGIRKRVEREIRRQHGVRSRDLRSLWRWVSEKEGISLEKLLANVPDP
jgi:RNA polymerase sigma-70 factor (ECF subfamily)